MQVKNITGNSDKNEILFLSVKINENLSKIKEVLEEDGIAGFLTFEGKLIENPKDFTFAKMFIKNNAKFAIITAAGSGL